MKILSIDVGGTRIKAAVIPQDVTLNQLKEIIVHVKSRWGWLNNNLPRIVDPDLWASFTNKDSKLGPFDAIAIDGPWSVSKNMISNYHYIDELGIPSNLEPKLNELTNKRVVCNQNDAEAWLKGIIKYYELDSETIQYPVFAIILGTGIGLAHANSNQKICGIELGAINSPFTRIRKFEDFKQNWDIHDRLSEREFFKSLSEKDDRKKWDYVRVRAEYTSRIGGLIKDILSAKELKPSTICIGGGLSEYVSERTIKEYTKIEAKVIRRQDFKINPDLIPLIGNTF
jgi:hypothetical protein